jgi:hypothetical protein
MQFLLESVYQFFVSVCHFFGEFNTKIRFCVELIKFIEIFSTKLSKPVRNMSVYQAIILKMLMPDFDILR